MRDIPKKVQNLVENAYAGEIESRNALAHLITTFSFNAGALAMCKELPRESSYDLTPPIMDAFIKGDYRSSWDLMTFAGRTIIEKIIEIDAAKQAHISGLEELSIMDMNLGC